jgi:hypothetical protein
MGRIDPEYYHYKRWVRRNVRRYKGNARHISVGDDGYYFVNRKKRSTLKRGVFARFRYYIRKRRG